MIERIPKDALVIICDSERALFLSNAGTPVRPSLALDKVLETDTAAAAIAPNSDRPGRMMDRGSAGSASPSRSAMEPTDLRRIQAANFAAEVASELSQRHSKGGYKALIIAAPPEFLGHLRDEMTPQTRGTIISEIPKRLTEQTLDQISGALAPEW